MVIFHGKNLRHQRVSLRNQYYLLTSVTHNRQPLFLDFKLARICINALRHQHETGQVNSLAFVVMPDHFHWLIQLEAGTLAKVMQTVKGSSSSQINKVRSSSDQVWQHGYFDHALRREEDIRQVGRYLAANPLRAGLVEDLFCYPHWDAVWLE